MMKKTLTVNLNGRIFQIDQDAYELLDKYLSNLRFYFRKEEGTNEIIADFEARIEELFSECIAKGQEVITIEDTERVIKQVGKPEDFDQEAEDIKHDNASSNPNSEEKKSRKKLYRNIDNKVFGGICSGIGAFFGWDPTIIRLVFALLILPTAGWMIVIYVIMWAIIPAAGTAEEKLEMQGEKVSLENIGKMVSSEIQELNKNEHAKGCLGALVDIAAAFLKVGVVICAIAIGAPLLFALFIVVVVLFAVVFGLGGGLLTMLPFNLGGICMAGDHPILLLISILLIVGIPVFSIIYSIISYLGKLKPMPKIMKWITAIIWFIALIMFLVFGVRYLNDGGWRISNKHRYMFHNSESSTIKGNGQITQRIDTLPAFKILVIKDGLWENVQIEIDPLKNPLLKIEGESNIIDKIQWNHLNDKLNLDMDENYNLKPNSDISITLRVPKIEGVEIESVGEVRLLYKLEADQFRVKMSGTGSFYADSLYCGAFHSEIEGIGNLHIKGKAHTAFLEVKGAARIEAFDFESDEVDAVVKGLGSIECNPLSKLNATVEGIGKIQYKNEPINKNIQIEGLGKVRKY